MIEHKPVAEFQLVTAQAGRLPFGFSGPYLLTQLVWSLV
jgi:hypothetical protein